MVVHEGRKADEFRRQTEIVLQKIAEMPATEGALTVVADVARASGRAAASLATAMGPAAFAEHWKWARLALPLQTRLAAEQGLWDLGGDYRRLVSGFKPIEGAGDEEGRVGRPAAYGGAVRRQTSQQKRELRRKLRELG